MCGRYTIARPERVLAVFAPRTIRADLSRPRYNIAPMQKVPVVIGKAEERSIVDCQWGLVPGWADDPGIGSRMINARAETVAISGMFRRAFAQRRCLVPAEPFYEWRKTGGPKVPYAFVRKDRQPMAFDIGLHFTRQSDMLTNHFGKMI